MSPAWCTAHVNLKAYLHSLCKTQPTRLQLEPGPTKLKPRVSCRGAAVSPRGAPQVGPGICPKTFGGRGKLRVWMKGLVVLRGEGQLFQARARETNRKKGGTQTQRERETWREKRKKPRGVRKNFECSIFSQEAVRWSRRKWRCGACAATTRTPPPWGTAPEGSRTTYPEKSWNKGEF